MFDGALAAAWVGASLTAKQMQTLTNAIRRYNDVFRNRMSAFAAWWSATDRRLYSQDEIIAIAGSASSSSSLEPPVSDATITADIALSLSERGQTYRGDTLRFSQTHLSAALSPPQTALPRCGDFRNP